MRVRGAEDDFRVKPGQVAKWSSKFPAGKDQGVSMWKRSWPLNLTCLLCSGQEEFGLKGCTSLRVSQCYNGLIF